ncbi:hypothetical protein BH11MYX4_BH11MYX4_05170 [soil metagenome]
MNLKQAIGYLRRAGPTIFRPVIGSYRVSGSRTASLVSDACSLAPIWMDRENLMILATMASLRDERKAAR